MTVYSTLRDKEIIEYFGDKYDPKTRLLQKSIEESWKIERYYHQEVNSDDLFLLMPKFSQVSLVTLLRKDNFNPIYLTIQNEESSNKTFFEDIGALCSVEDIFSTLTIIKEFSKIVERYSYLPEILSSSLLADREKKSISSIPLIAINNKIDYALKNGTRDIGRNSNYQTRYKSIFFIQDDIRYYCSFTTYKTFIFTHTPDDKSNASLNFDILEIIERYIDFQNEILNREELFCKNNKKSNFKLNKKELAEEKQLAVAFAQKEIEIENSSDKTFFLQIKTENPDDESKKDIFYPIPISHNVKTGKKYKGAKETIYQEFYPFIISALKKDKLYISNYDETSTEVSIFVKDSQYFTNANQKDFYIRYSLFLLAQFTLDIRKILPKKSSKQTQKEYDDTLTKEEKELKKSHTEVLDKTNSTLYEIIENLAYKKMYHQNIANQYSIQGADMILHYNSYVNRINEDEVDESSGKMLKLAQYFKDNNNISNYFESTPEINERISLDSQTIMKNLKKNTTTEKAEMDQLIKFRIKIQDKICKQNKDKESCLNEEDCKKICHGTKGKRFQAFEHYFDRSNHDSYYYKLDKNCQELIDLYFSTSFQSYNTIDDKVEGDFYTGDYNSNETEDSDESCYDNTEYKEQTLVNLDILDEYIKEYRSLSVFEINKLVETFLKSYQNFEPTLEMFYSIKIAPYIQFFYIYKTSYLSSIVKQPPEIVEAKKYIEKILFLLKSSKTKEVIGLEAYYDLIERFFLNLSMFNVIDWINEQEIYDANSWIELKEMLNDNNTDKYIQDAKEYLNDLANIKIKVTDRDKVSHSMNLLNVYIRTILETDKLLNYDVPNEQRSDLISNKKMLIFKQFLQTNPSKDIMFEYLKTVVIDAWLKDI